MVRYGILKQSLVAVHTVNRAKGMDPHVRFAGFMTGVVIQK